MIDEAELALWDLHQLEMERQKRVNMLSQMVGWLYPAILQEELIQIQMRQSKLRGSTMKGDMK